MDFEHFENTFFLLLLGAIFPPIFTQSEIAFRAAVRRANLNTNSFELVPSIKHVSDLDSFKAEITGKLISNVKILSSSLLLIQRA